MHAALKHHLQELTSPLTLAAFAAWGVVWAISMDAIAQHMPQYAGSARLAMLVFLAGFVLQVATPWLESPGRSAVVALIMAASAMWVIGLRPWSASSILLVLLAAVLAVRIPPRGLILALAAINLLVLWIMLRIWQYEFGDALISVLAYGSFQVFAVMLMLTARRAEAMAEDLRAANAELLTTRSLLADSARDQERLRLSRELHDVAGHSLTALKLNLRVLSQDPAQPDPERVQLCAQLADELLGNLRAVVKQMRVDNDFDLQAAIERLGLPFPRPRLALELEPELRLRGRERIEAVLRAVQEALTNAARHGYANNLQVKLGQSAQQLQLLIDDDGRASGGVEPGGGLSGMRERFEQLGGGLALERSPLGGLRLRAWCPLQEVV